MFSACNITTEVKSVKVFVKEFAKTLNQNARHISHIFCNIQDMIQGVNKIGRNSERSEPNGAGGFGGEGGRVG